VGQSLSFWSWSLVGDGFSSRLLQGWWSGMACVQHAPTQKKICYFRTLACFEVSVVYLFRCLLLVLFFIFLKSFYRFLDIASLFWGLFSSDLSFFFGIGA
jgi:hypothetical protein